MDIYEERLQQALARDAEYQALLKECRGLEEEYNQILDSLSLLDRELIERYIMLCEELDHRRAYLAVHLHR